jgi:hypothetical protein
VLHDGGPLGLSQPTISHHLKLMTGRLTDTVTGDSRTRFRHVGVSRIQARHHMPRRGPGNGCGRASVPEMAPTIASWEVRVLSFRL